MIPDIIAKIKADIAAQEAYIAEVDGREDEYGKNQRYYSQNRIRTLNNELRAAITANIPPDVLETLCAAWADGRVVVLPVKVGDTVYRPELAPSVPLKEMVCIGFKVVGGTVKVICHEDGVEIPLVFTLGETAHLNREAAATALQEGQG